MSVRVRIAPSPTGDPHVGTAYVAAFNWLFAKKHNGKFILRIEDTDLQRSRPEYETQIIEALQWLGLTWDEGPDIGGSYGPYRQSQRGEIYKKYAYELLERGHAYKCFATTEELTLMRKLASGGRKGYDRRYRYMSSEEIKQRESSGQPFVIRLKVPTEDECTYTDMVRGKLKFPFEDVDDQIILKSDGMPTYHLANVVDDHLMGITHVLRGDEWISSAPKHLFMYQSFGWVPPTFAHLPLLLGSDGKKLSKRKSPTSILFYKDSGFLPEALLNFLMLMGYSSDKDEICSIDQIADNFDITKIGCSGAFFDIKRLEWINKHYINSICSDDDLKSKLQSWFLNYNFIDRVIPLAKSRIKTLAEFVQLSHFLFCEPTQEQIQQILAYPTAPTKQKAMILQTLIWELDKLTNWNKNTIDACSRSLAEIWNVNHKSFIMPLLFITLTGQRHSLPLFDSFELIGKHRARARILSAINTLGTLSRKELETLEKHWTSNTIRDL